MEFSVIIPVYNRETCVHLAIESICKQDYPNWELILVDDGSTDKTAEICRKYAAADSRIRYHYKRNGGVSSARNFGIQLARGEYILFLDSDDSLAGNCLRVLDSRIGVCCEKPDMLCFGTESSSKQWRATDCEIGVYIPKENIRELYLPTHINLYPQTRNFLLNYIWNKCYRADFIRQNQLSFDENRRTWEDGLFVVNCLDNAKDIILIPDVLHNGCADPTVDHLSGKFYESQIDRYLQDETDFKTRFEGEYDFSSEHYCRMNLGTLNILFAKAYAVCGKHSKALMKNAAEQPIVLHWVMHISPQCSYERYIKACVINRKYKWVFCFYRLNAVKQSILKQLHL